MNDLNSQSKSVYENIKKFRELKNISRQHMASELELSLSGYSKLERGEVDVSISRITQISKLLGVDVSHLLNFDTNQIFNLNNNQLIQGTGTKANTVHYHSDEYLVKYVRILEDENLRLKSIIEKNQI